jgi:hypothetical protein
MATPFALLTELLRQPRVEFSSPAFRAIAPATREALRAAAFADGGHLNDMTFRSARIRGSGAEREIVLATVTSSGRKSCVAHYVAEGGRLIGKTMSSG